LAAVMGETGEAVLEFFVQVVALALAFASCWAFFKAMSR
jgi:hypothetical protein